MGVWHHPIAEMGHSSSTALWCARPGTGCSSGAPARVLDDSSRYRRHLGVVFAMGRLDKGARARISGTLTFLTHFLDQSHCGTQIARGVIQELRRKQEVR